MCGYVRIHFCPFLKGRVLNVTRAETLRNWEEPSFKRSAHATVKVNAQSKTLPIETCSRQKGPTSRRASHHRH